MSFFLGFAASTFAFFLGMSTAFYLHSGDHFTSMPILLLGLVSTIVMLLTYDMSRKPPTR